MASLPDILQRIIIYGLLIALIAVVAILIVPTLFISRQTRTRDDDDQELCTNCGYDVRGLLCCPECAKPTREARRQRLEKLRDDWPTESITPRVPGVHEQPTLILTTDDNWAGRLLCQHLKARGIAANLNEIVGVSLPGYTTARSTYRLNVWSDDEERARAIVNHLWPEEIRTKTA